MATGAQVRKTKLDRSSIEDSAFNGYIKSVQDILYVTDTINGDSEVTINPGNVGSAGQNWETFTINPTNPVVNPFQFSTNNNIKKDTDNKSLIRILFNGLELDSDEFVVAANKRLVTLSLPNNLTIDNTDELKIWYVKE